MKILISYTADYYHQQADICMHIWSANITNISFDKKINTKSEIIYINI